MNRVTRTDERHAETRRSPGAGARGRSPAVEEDESIMPAVGGGGATLDALYAQYWADLVKYVNGMLSDPHQAEEIVQETMLRAWRHAEKLTPERGSVWGWLSRVAHNVMVDRIRRKRARPAEVDESAATPAMHVTADHSPDVANSVDVQRALAQLQPAHRAVLYLVYYSDRTCAEAAAILGVPVGTVKSRLHYAMRYLRTVLEQHRTEHD